MEPQRGAGDIVAIRLAELQEAMLVRSAMDYLLEHSATEDESVSVVMGLWDKIVTAKRRGRSYA